MTHPACCTIATGLCLFSCVWFASASAWALNCEDHVHSSCIDSNQQWLSFEPGPFVAVPRAQPSTLGKPSLTLAGVYQHRPLTLTAASPDSSGRDIPLVKHVIDTQLMLYAALAYGFDLGVALRSIPYQDGSGIGAIRSRTGSRLEKQAIRDPLVGLGYGLARGVRHASKLRLDLSIPLGDADQFAGAAGVVAQPAVVGELLWPRIDLALALGGRFRTSSTLGDVRVGNQLLAKLGMAVIAVPEILTVAGELTVEPSLGRHPVTPLDERASWFFAEWGLTVTTHWADAYHLSLNGGSGIPVASQSVRSGADERREYFNALGAPQLRFVLMLRVIQSRL